jgi:hypothetical protein
MPGVEIELSPDDQTNWGFAHEVNSRGTTLAAPSRLAPLVGRFKITQPGVHRKTPRQIPDVVLHA